MGCSCNGGSGGSAKATWVVTANGQNTSYSSEIEARAAAQRLGGTFRKQ